MTHQKRELKRTRRRLAARGAPGLVAIFAACGGETGTTHPVLLDPDDPAFSAQAPATFRARFETSKGTFVVEVVREWAPRGADRFYNLVRNGFYDDVRFFRAIAGFMVQFGLSGDPAVTAAWQDRTIPDDPVQQTNAPGYLTFAMTSSPNSRTTQVFINLIHNARLDELGFAPIGRVVEGMDVVQSLYTGYGEGTDQGRIRAEGNAYLERSFPRLDYVRRATIEAED